MDGVTRSILSEVIQSHSSLVMAGSVLSGVSIEPDPVGE